MRRQGYATEKLKVALKKMKERNMLEVKIVCTVDNILSKKTIIACQGKLNRVIKTYDTEKEEYLITL